MTWREIADYSLLALIFLPLLIVLFRGKAYRLISLLGSYGALWYISKFFKLKTAYLVLSNVWQIFVFSILVIFQPELRRIFHGSMVGRNPYSRKSSKRYIKKVIMAVSWLSKRKIGALIVFERKMPVSNLCEGCIKLDALISSELLMTIFFPHTPLHDGAVILKGNKIVYASCVLPLAKNLDSDFKLGTRHRAGVGITQETDAIAIIVSEETGNISVAYEGKLFRNLTEQELEDFLIKKLFNKN
jgi:uncharacterized protein (TIGR00159 family)